MQYWENPPRCYEKWLPLDFMAPETDFVFLHTNNMVNVSYSSCACTMSEFTGEHPSQDVVVVGDRKTDDYILIGAVTAFRSMTFFSVHRKARVTGVMMRQPDIAVDGEPEKVIILRGNDWRKLLKEYAECAAREMGVSRSTPQKNITGYCSWYYYYAGVTQDDLLENIEAVSKRRNERYHVDVIQIDDGYQTFQGDWLDRDASWPEPLETVAEKINAAGAVPGIWLMPFLASTASRIFREHPELFVKNKNGEVLVFSGWSPAPDNHWACLDATLPETREHISAFMKTMRAKGFRYFKMDGLGFALVDGVFHDPDATSVSAFRLGLKTIREAVPDAILLGCCPPFMACLGYVDMCRVSCDTSRMWFGGHPKYVLPQNCDGAGVGIKNSLHGVEANWFVNDIWFRSDPDVVMARADNAWYSAGEARLSAAAAILTGVALTSDHLGKISDDRYEILAAAAELRLSDAYPADWEADRWPTVFTGKCGEKRAALFLNDTEEELVFEFARWGLPETCIEKLAQKGKVVSQLAVPAHDAAFVIAV